MNRLYRSRRDRVLLGVCGGIARYFHVDPVLVRVIWVLLSLTSFPGIIAYIVAAILMPEEPAFQEARPSASAAAPAPSGQAGQGAGPGPEDEGVRQRTIRLLGWGLVAVGAMVLVYNWLVMAGVGHMLRTHYPFLDWNFWLRLSVSWWPVILILLGAVILWRGVRKVT